MTKTSNEVGRKNSNGSAVPEAKCTSGIIRITATLYEIKFWRKAVFGIKLRLKKNLRD